MSWALSASWQEVDFRQGRNTQNDRLQASLNVVPDVDFSFALRVGQEGTNVGSQDSRRYDNWGGSVRWTPSPRTTASLDTDRRYFGNSHKLSLEHRMARSSIRISSVRDVSNGADTRSVASPITLYQLVSSQLTALEPDPVLRDRLVQAFIAASYPAGTDPSQVVGSAPLAAGISLIRREDLGFSYSGLRTSLSLIVFSSDAKVLDGAPQAQSDGRVRQWGYTGSLAYKLNPLDTVNLTGSQQRTLSNEVRRGNDLKAISLGWTGQLGRRASSSLTVRHAVFSSDTNPYKESALSGSISLRF